MIQGNVGTAAMWTAILVGTPLLMKTIDFSKLNNLCAMDSTKIEKQLDSMDVGDPVIRAHVNKTIRETLSGDCREVMKKTLALVEKNKAAQGETQSLSINMPDPDGVSESGSVSGSRPSQFVQPVGKDFTNE